PARRPRSARDRPARTSRQPAPPSGRPDRSPCRRTGPSVRHRSPRRERLEPSSQPGVLPRLFRVTEPGWLFFPPRPPLQSGQRYGEGDGEGEPEGLGDGDGLGGGSGTTASDSDAGKALRPFLPANIVMV